MLPRKWLRKEGIRVSWYHPLSALWFQPVLFFFNPKDWNDSPITSCSGSTTQSFIASACPSRCVAWGRSHDDENWSIRDLRWEEKTLPQGLRADAFMTWCLTQCVVSLKWPMAGPVPFTVTFPCHGKSNTEARNAALYQRSAWWEWATDLGRLTCWRYAKMRFP